MAKTKAKKVKILKFAFIAFSIYVVVSFIVIQSDISKRKDNLDAAKNELEQQQYLNKDIMNIINSGENSEYIMRIAREKLGFVFPNERVFIDISGNNK
ncbi:septum formation initiator family protein [Paludicola sp. MB14-C6]|uniref:septum formation initiator family protein n=1 Tax=Paludihabitans sp. MB14-C6 TaxID=3070656 RepID=UPI0027DE3D92|nr:septum formation initiator family protein [Paludicola sp. MB14-C6]WMJ23660.1 septum formation initiator family protein [Paludicola sp. MB14-C6]